MNNRAVFGISTIAAFAFAACSNSSPDVPDARRVIDSGAPIDATPTTISLTLTIAGSPSSGAVVLADGPNGTQTQATTDSSGDATVNVSGTSDVTLALVQGGGAQFITIGAVAAGQHLILSIPSDDQKMQINVGGTSPDTSTFSLAVPASEGDPDNTVALAGDGTTSHVNIPANGATTPIDLVALTSDATQYVAITGQTFTSGQSVQLPSTWSPVSTVTINASALPSDVTSVFASINSFSDNLKLETGGAGNAATPDTGAATVTTTFAPVGSSFRTGLHLANGGSSQIVFRHTAQAPTTVAVTGSELAPWISNATATSSPARLQWTVTDSGGTATLVGCVLGVNYSLGENNVQWSAILPGDATSWTLPTLPASLAQWAPASDTSISIGNFFAVSQTTTTTNFPSFRTLFLAHPNLFSGDDSALGDFVVTAPSLN